MMDGGCGIDVDLIYSVFEDEDVITRSVSVKMQVIRMSGSQRYILHV